MSLFVSSLNSGSNGNCYYIGSREEAVLIDVGLSMREVERRLKRQDLSLKKVRAIFITHEHSDHIGGLRKLARKHQLPVYMTHETRRETRIGPADIQFSKSGEVAGDLGVMGSFASFSRWMPVVGRTWRSSCLQIRR